MKMIRILCFLLKPSSTMEKVTFNIPTELKEQVIALKDELKVLLSTIANYIKQKELEKWQKRVDITLSKEFGSDNEDISSKNITI